MRKQPNKPISDARYFDIVRALDQVKTEGAWPVRAAHDGRAALADGRAAGNLRAVDAASCVGEISAMAERRAEHMMDVICGAPAGLCLEGFRDWLQAQLEPIQGGRLRISKGATEAEARRGLIGRATCKDWWRRALTKAATLARENEGRACAKVWAGREQYITNETMRRKLNRDEKNAALLERTELENEDGQVYNLAELAAVSVSNPAIRRGELMTRIRGCEEWAEAHGMVGIFTTQTTPSRFHAVRRHGGINEKWIEAGKPTPKDGQRWLCDAWARARAELDRRGLSIFGFRVAEPHHDGTPHWHGLFWSTPRNAARVAVVIRRHWLKGEVEAGAKQHRFKCKALKSGGAAGYIAKYIAKGIDDAGAVGMEGHDDDIQGRAVRMDQGDMFGGGAARVRAWASAHGIRQFQPIGQPPVSVWRELRRVPDVQAQASERIAALHVAVSRSATDRANFAHYMVRQGGPFVGRAYRVAVAVEERAHVGRYEDTTQARPVGVVDRVVGAVAYSNRKEWRPRGAWGARVRGETKGAKPRPSHAARPACHWPVGSPVRESASYPWTRVNNCTDQRPPKPKKLSYDWWEIYPPELVAQIREQQAAREGRSHTETGGDGRHRQPVDRPRWGPSGTKAQR